MTLLITGATGLIGQEIVKLCHQNNYTVHYLSTSKSKIENKANYKGFYWNPDTFKIDLDCFKNVESIIHLAGASIAKRWTPDYKKTIISSRVDSTNLLIDSLKKMPHSVKQVVAASAIGIYPDSELHYYDENFSEYDDSFLHNVVKKWEAAVDGFETLGIKIAKIRTGLVLSDHGGALPHIIKPIKIGAGAPLGSGKQWQSWIHVKDLATIYLYILEMKLSGVFNGVAPNPVTNEELTKAIAKQLNKPLILPKVPRFFLKLALGDMHALLVESQRVSSKKIEETGFNFEYENITPALADILG